MKHVQQMKSVLVSLNSTAQKIHRDMERNASDFKPDISATANAQLQETLNKAALTARAQIDAIHEEAAAAVKKWAEPTGAEIDMEDLSLLTGGFSLKAEDLHSLLVKHQGNGTMVNAIAKYAGANKMELSYIPNVEDKLYAYQAFADSAHAMIGSIVESTGLNDSNLTLTKWAEPGNISQRMELAIYGIKKAEEPQPVPARGVFNFGFKPLEGR